MNSVKYIQDIKFSQLTINEKINIKGKGRPTPILSIEQSSSKQNNNNKKKTFTRHFHSSVYEKCNWICGCDDKNALFCFPCILFGGDPVWTRGGVIDLKHLQDKIRKHQKSIKHKNNMIDLHMMGKVNIATQLDNAYKLSIAQQNEEIRKNRDALSKIINCIKFCGKYELTLIGHDETQASENSGVFRGLVDFTCQLDSSFKAHLNSSITFKGTSKSIQNELLESMLVLCKNKIKEEVKQAEYLAVMCDETTDIHDRTQMVIVLRYEHQGKPVERFWGFFNPVNQTAEALSSILLRELQILIGESPHKLIAQTYDGAAALSGVNKGVQSRIKEAYSNAHFVHCYAHQLNLLLEQATSQNTNVRVFFNSLSGIPNFSSRSSQRMSALENVAGRRVPRPSSTCWNFKSRAVNAVKEMKDQIIECCSILEASKSRETGSAAAGIKRLLNDFEFEFWLNFFSKVMPHVDIMFSQLQSILIDAVKANNYLQTFNYEIQKIRDEYINISFPSEPKRRKFNTDRSIAAKEVCDVILIQCRERFSFTKHLEASKLFLIDNFLEYMKHFPSDALGQAVASYPMLEKENLRTELSMFYSRTDMYHSRTLIAMLDMVSDENLGSTFSNITRLLQILITTPMTTSEAERCFSTLKRIKTFLRSTMGNERLNALTMLSIESEMVCKIPDFNEKVIENFSTSKTRRTNLIFK